MLPPACVLASSIEAAARLLLPSFACRTLATRPRPPRDDGVAIEVRAGAGGAEAGAFAAALFRMYRRFAETQGWSWEV